MLQGDDWGRNCFKASLAKHSRAMPRLDVSAPGAPGRKHPLWPVLPKPRPPLPSAALRCPPLPSAAPRRPSLFSLRRISLHRTASRSKHGKARQGLGPGPPLALQAALRTRDPTPPGSDRYRGLWQFHMAMRRASLLSFNPRFS